MSPSPGWEQLSTSLDICCCPIWGQCLSSRTSGPCTWGCWERCHLLRCSPQGAVPISCPGWDVPVLGTRQWDLRGHTGEDGCSFNQLSALLWVNRCYFITYWEMSFIDPANKGYGAFYLEAVKQITRQRLSSALRYSGTSLSAPWVLTLFDIRFPPSEKTRTSSHHSPSPAVSSHAVCSHLRLCQHSRGGASSLLLRLKPEPFNLTSAERADEAGARFSPCTVPVEPRVLLQLYFGAAEKPGSVASQRARGFHASCIHQLFFPEMWESPMMQPFSIPFACFPDLMSILHEVW